MENWIRSKLSEAENDDYKNALMGVSDANMVAQCVSPQGGCYLVDESTPLMQTILSMHPYTRYRVRMFLSAWTTGAEDSPTYVDATGIFRGFERRFFSAPHTEVVRLYFFEEGFELREGESRSMFFKDMCRVPMVTVCPWTSVSNLFFIEDLSLSAAETVLSRYKRVEGDDDNSF